MDKTIDLGLKPELLEGGFIQVHKRLWRGTVRYRSDKTIVWRCKHNHSRAEYNARYSGDPVVVWEYSALNCGRAARDQWPDNVKGLIGLIGDSQFPLDQRDDTRTVRVQDQTFVGRVTLSGSGRRILTVSNEVTSPSIYGVIDLDVAQSKGVAPPAKVSSEVLSRWAMAAWLLKGTVWGVVFQDPRVSISVDEISQRALEEILNQGKPLSEAPKGRLSLPEQYDRRKRAVRGDSRPAKPRIKKLPKEATQPSSASTPVSPREIKHPRMEVTIRKGRRVYEIVDGEVVLETFYQRGKAAQALADLKEQT